MKPLRFKLSSCKHCNSSFHNSDTCYRAMPPTNQRVCNILTLPDDHSSIAPDFVSPQQQSNYHQHIATQPLELYLRTLYAPPRDPKQNHTTTSGARQCPIHHDMQLQHEGKAPCGQNALTKIVDEAFDTTFIKSRTPLPLCAACVEAETEFEELLLPPGLDLCRCATSISLAQCPNCVIQDINVSWKLAFRNGKMTFGESTGRVYYGCQKDNLDQGNVKQCVFCKGVVVTALDQSGGW